MTTSRRRKAAETELRELCLYSPEDSSSVDLGAVAEYVRSLFPSISVRVCPPATRGLRGGRLEEVALAFASARVKDLSKRIQSFEPMYGEIDYERRGLLGKAKLGGIVYDGAILKNAYTRLLAAGLSLERCSVVITNRLFSTYSGDDLRHHLRTVVCGFPSLISIPGIVEAPAKPREYHILKQQLEIAGASDFELSRLKSDFRGRFVDYEDPLMNEVLKGLVLQAIVFHLTLKPFCEDRRCRLFNAHWQEDLLESQVKSGELCKSHSRLMRRLADRPVLAWQ